MTRDSTADHGFAVAHDVRVPYMQRTRDYYRPWATARRTNGLTAPRFHFNR
jgi:hypothetical protein